MLKRFWRHHPKLASVGLILLILLIASVAVASSVIIQQRTLSTSSKAAVGDSCGSFNSSSFGFITNIPNGGGVCDGTKPIACRDGIMGPIMEGNIEIDCQGRTDGCYMRFDTRGDGTTKNYAYVGCSMEVDQPSEHYKVVATSGGGGGGGGSGCGNGITEGGGECRGTEPWECRGGVMRQITDNGQATGNKINCAINNSGQCFMKKNAPFDYVGCSVKPDQTDLGLYTIIPETLGGTQPGGGNQSCTIGDNTGVSNGKFACDGTTPKVCVNGTGQLLTGLPAGFKCDQTGQTGRCAMKRDFSYVGCSKILNSDPDSDYKFYSGSGGSQPQPQPQTHFQCDCGTSRCVQVQGGGGNLNGCSSANGTCSCGGGGAGSGGGNGSSPPTTIACERCSASFACYYAKFAGTDASCSTPVNESTVEYYYNTTNDPYTSTNTRCNAANCVTPNKGIIKKSPVSSGGAGGGSGGGGTQPQTPQTFACPGRCSNTYGCYFAKFDSATGDATGCNNPINVKYYYHVAGDLYSEAGNVGACSKIQGESTCGSPPNSQTVKKAPGAGGGGAGGGGAPQQSRDQRFTCLKTEACWVHGSTPTCPNHNEGSEERPNFRLGLAHAAKLSGKGDNQSNPNGATDSLNPLTTAESYVLECVSVASRPEGPICTTGKRDTDLQLFGVNNVDTLFELTRYAPATNDDAASTKDENAYRFDQFVKCEKNGGGECALGGEEENDNRFTNVTNPRPTRNAGANFGTYYWQSYTAAYLPRRYFALNYFTAAPQEGPAEPAGPTLTQTETQKSLQQATLNFARAVAPVTIPEPEDRNCTVISYDPYGKVFDAQTLEPIAGAVVTLLRKRADGSYTKVLPNERLFEVIKNPFITESDGGYYFPVTDGDYKLSVEHPDYDFPAQASSLNRDHAKIYSDIYPALTGDVITQKGGNPEHRDIPITLKANHTYSQRIELKGYFNDPTPDGSNLSGFVSHPFANFTFYTKKIPAKGTVATRYREIGKTQADKEGKFSFKVNAKNFEPGEYFGEADIEKNFAAIPNQPQVNNVINSSSDWFNKLLIKEAQAQDKMVTTVSFEPIPTYLEGYAYDSKGELVRAGEVSLYLSYSELPYATTVTDKNGFFRFPSNQIPSAQYKIIARSEGSGEVPIRTSAFIEKNTKYLAENKVDVYSIQDDTKVQSPDLTQKSNGSGESNTSSGGQKTVTPITTQTAASSSGFVLGLLLAVLGVAMVVIVGMLVFYLIKIRNQNTSV